MWIDQRYTLVAYKHHNHFDRSFKSNISYIYGLPVIFGWWLKLRRLIVRFEWLFFRWCLSSETAKHSTKPMRHPWILRYLSSHRSPKHPRKIRHTAAPRLYNYLDAQRWSRLWNLDLCRGWQLCMLLRSICSTSSSLQLQPTTRLLVWTAKIHLLNYQSLVGIFCPVHPYYLGRRHAQQPRLYPCRTKDPET